MGTKNVDWVPHMERRRFRPGDSAGPTVWFAKLLSPRDMGAPPIGVQRTDDGPSETKVEKTSDG